MMDILVLGAGRSSSWLIRLLATEAQSGLKVSIADLSVNHLQTLYGQHPNLELIELQVEDEALRYKLIENHKVIISLLPPSLHIMAARDCVNARRHLVTASYLSAEIKALDPEAQASGVVLLNELGLDPGIDHLSAMELLDRLRSDGARIEHFESHCGGLIAPAFDNNPWHYKFTWNPRNVVLAGQAAAHFRWHGRERILPAQHIFTETWPLLIPGLGDYEVYANRDSLGYQQAYGLEGAATLLRGTIRKAGFSIKWRALQEWGFTDNNTLVPAGITLRDLSNLLLSSPDKIPASIHQNNPAIQEALEWLDLFNPVLLPAHVHTPAQALQWWLEQKWKLNEGDKDMIIMIHRVGYQLDGQSKTATARLVVQGEDQQYTAMAKTVGLPLGLAALQLLKGHWNLKGVQIPTHPLIYQSLLPQLAQFDIAFEHD